MARAALTTPSPRAPGPFSPPPHPSSTGCSFRHSPSALPCSAPLASPTHRPPSEITSSSTLSAFLHFHPKSVLCIALPSSSGASVASLMPSPKASVLALQDLTAHKVPSAPLSALWPLLPSAAACQTQLGHMLLAAQTSALFSRCPLSHPASSHVTSRRFPSHVQVASAQGRASPGAHSSSLQPSQLLSLMTS